MVVPLSVLVPLCHVAVGQCGLELISGVTVPNPASSAVLSYLEPRLDHVERSSHGDRGRGTSDGRDGILRPCRLPVLHAHQLFRQRRAWVVGVWHHVSGLMGAGRLVDGSRATKVKLA